MRFVIYDDETLEPITVINLKGVTEKDIKERGYLWRIAVHYECPVFVGYDGPTTFETTKTVDLFFEPFVRNGTRHGEQHSWMCFTRATELAMLLIPDWLPGQRGAVNYLQDQNDRLTEMLMSAMLSR